MYNVNIILRTIILIIFSIVIVFIDNYYLFWLLVFYTLLLSIVDKNLKSLLINFATVLILLFCTYTNIVKLILKILCITNFCILYYFSFTKKDKFDIYYRNMYRNSSSSRKRLFYDHNFSSVLKYNQDKSSSIYGSVILNDKVESDLDSKYLYGKVRYYGYSNKFTELGNYSWKWYDLLYSLVAITVLILLLIYR